MYLTHKEGEAKGLTLGQNHELSNVMDKRHKSKVEKLKNTLRVINDVINGKVKDSHGVKGPDNEMRDKVLEQIKIWVPELIEKYKINLEKAQEAERARREEVPEVRSEYQIIAEKDRQRVTEILAEEKRLREIEKRKRERASKKLANTKKSTIDEKLGNEGKTDKRPPNLDEASPRMEKDKEEYTLLPDNNDLEDEYFNYLASSDDESMSEQSNWSDQETYLGQTYTTETQSFHREVIFMTQK
ncbi:hypothetical protein JTB14_002009 [Gonioctena quinquepunctata]|nr:hypothetical protein JTB14_002009 [Gonioctena quinquepunctata]